ncbi:MAG: hypothetical protein MO852_11800 [Candidatus Devosia euplotis]|nr:hypothetical protein [Candidatus Devosia euplotis]
MNLSLLIDNGPQTAPVFEAYIAVFEAANPDIKIDMETRPGGAEGDNIVKIRLAAGVMADVFSYNSG